MRNTSTHRENLHFSHCTDLNICFSSDQDTYEKEGGSPTTCSANFATTTTPSSRPDELSLSLSLFRRPSKKTARTIRRKGGGGRPQQVLLLRWVLRRVSIIIIAPRWAIIKTA